MSNNRYLKLVEPRFATRIFMFAPSLTGGRVETRKKAIQNATADIAEIRY